MENLVLPPGYCCRIIARTFIRLQADELDGKTEEPGEDKARPQEDDISAGVVEVGLRESHGGRCSQYADST